MAEAALRNFTLNFGPQHPAAHGVLRLVLELDGEVVERVDPHIGVLHRGTGKLIEHKTHLQALPNFDRLDYVAPMNQERAFGAHHEAAPGEAAAAAGPGPRCRPRPQDRAALARRDEALDGGDHRAFQALQRRPSRARRGSHAAVEAPKGEFGVYLVADGTNRPYKCKIRAPSFAHLQAMDFLSRGHMLADGSAIIGSLDIVFGEIDR